MRLANLGGPDGPTIAVHRSLSDDPERSSALDRDLAALGDQLLAGDADAMAWEYLIVTGRRATPR